MDENPYEAPRTSETPSRPLSAWALTKDTVALLAVSLLASVVGVPILFMVVMFLYGLLQYIGVPVP